MKPKPIRARLRQLARSAAQPRRAAPAREHFDAFIAYADLPSARQAMSAINDVLGATRQRPQLAPMLWRFDQLALAKWQEPSLAAAARASVVVLASATPGALTPELERWIGALLARKHGGRVTVVAILGHEDAWTISIDVPVKATAHGASMHPHPQTSHSATPFPTRTETLDARAA